MTIKIKGKTERIYYPDSDEYMITADVVEKAKDLDATMIVYSVTWSKPTFEGKEHAKNLNIRILANAGFLSILQKME